MNVDITNHLVPWVQVKRMLKEAKRTGWDEGADAFQAAHELDNIEPWQHIMPNPYAEDE